MQGSVVIDRFEIGEVAGSGGMGTVYRARDRESGRTVAFKVIAASGPSDLARFDREARVLADLAHPHVVRYVTRGVTGEGKPFLVLEWLEGETLSARLSQATPSLADAVGVVRKVARALGHAHARGVVHRDVKPSNIFLVGPGFDDPRLLDFGVARMISGTRIVTQSGTALGTAAYMAPEQARGRRDVDARVDTYALGCVLFECVAGHPPFEGEHVMAVLAKVLFDEPPRLQRLVHGVPDSLDDLVARLLAKDPAERPVNGDEVAELLSAIAADVAAGDGPLQLASDSPPRPLTAREQKLVAVVAMAPVEPGVPRGADAPTLAGEDVFAVEQFAVEAAAFGATFAPLADGSCVALLEAAGSATDLAWRAARCALALRARRPSLPLAVATGRVTAGRVPVGEVIDRVAGLLRAAAASSSPLDVRIDDLTSGLLDHRFDVASDEAGLVLRAERERPRAARELLGRPAPCVGRTRELRLLETLYDECSGDAVATAAIVTGEAGAGKSRILSEWLAKLEQRSPRPEVWVGRGDPVAAGSPLGLLASALRSALGLENGEPDAAEQRRIRARVGRHVSEENVGRLTEFLAEIVGVPFPAEHSVGLRSARGDPMLMGDQMRRAFEDFVVAETSAGPVVLVLEDAHWGDLASVRFLEAALRQARQRPLLAVVSGRPELVTAYPSLAALRGALRVDVGELPKKACEQFVEDILQGAVDRATRDVIVERAAGNAFFLEELVRFVAEGKSAEMPPTIIATLETKLQGLPAEARRLLRAASIFGNTFWADGARTLLGDTSSRARTEPAGNAQLSADVAHAMDVVVAADLVEARPTSRFPGEQELAFRHALVRDAAYQTLTERDRAAGHRLAGEWLLTAGERDAALLGEHFERGGAGGRAAACFTEAARQSLDRHDFSGALAFVARARRACAELAPPEEGALFLLAAEAHRWSGALGEAEDAARRALELLPRGSAAWFHAAEQLAALAGVHSDFRPAVLWRERIARGPCEPGAAEARLLALCAVGRRLFQLGDYAADEVVDFIESERRTSGGELDARVEAEVRRLLGARARHRGDVAGDLAHYEAALAAYERAGDVRGQTNALVSVAFSFIQLGDWTAARVRLQRALDEAKRHGLSPIATRAHQNLSLVLLAEGAFEEAARGAARVADEAKARGDVRFEGWTQVYVSRIALARGDAAAAVAAADRALACLGGSPPAYAGALAARALAVLAAGEPEEADVAAGEALAILEEYAGIEEFESLVYLASVKAAAAAGDVARAGRLAETAVARLDARASAIPDERLRASFLGEVPENAQLCAAAAALASTAPERDRARGRIDAVWSAAAFRRDAEVVIGRVAAHLDEAMSGRGYVTRGFPPPDALLAQAAGELSEEPTADLAALLEAVLARSPWQHHPRYVGHQVAATVPRATLLSLVASVLNNGMAAFESGPYVTVLERRVIDLLLAVAGMPSSGGGVLTSGGSLGNLTALLAARQAALGDSARGRGLAEAEPLAILASDQAHYSVERAAQIMGLGRESVVLVATDASYRMIPDEIPRACERARDLGRRPFAIVASAGATGTGAIDPLPRVADASETLGLWLHVDGAHGASALLSPRYRAALGGVERADSLVWDAHKMMSMPALATAVLFRDGRAPYATFAQSAAYLFEDRAEPPWFDIGLRTVECTKPLIALPLYGCLATLGTRVFADAIESAYDRARELAGLLRAAPDFELACEPDTNIVCFRYVRDGATDELQRSVRDRLRASGAFYCVTTVLRGRTYLRVSLMNPLTTRADLTALLEAIRSAVKLLAEGL